MSSVEINKTENGFLLSGKVQFNNVVALRKHGNDIIDRFNRSALQVDLSGVTSSDTSVLSLLLRWLSYANQQNKQVHYTAIPETLLKVVKVCGLTQLINGCSNG